MGPATVSRKHIGKVVISAGWIDLDLEPRAVGYNNGSLRHIPPGYRMTLKGIDGDYAFTYRSDEGVIRVPYVLLESWE